MIKKNNLKIKENYLKKIKIYKKYNEAYFNKSNPVVDDNVYDNLKNEILVLEKKLIVKNKLIINNSGFSFYIDY